MYLVSEKRYQPQYNSTKSSSLSMVQNEAISSKISHSKQQIYTAGTTSLPLLLTLRMQELHRYGYLSESKARQTGQTSSNTEKQKLNVMNLAKHLYSKTNTVMTHQTSESVCLSVCLISMQFANNLFNRMLSTPVTTPLAWSVEA